MGTDFAALLRGRIGKELDYGGYHFRLVDSDAERERAFRLRHRVFVAEGYIEVRPSEVEPFRDAFEDVSAHVLAFDANRQVIGTTRFVLPSPLGFPTERLFDFDPPDCPRQRLGEFGRLAIDAGHRGGARAPMLGMIKMVLECIRANGIEFIYAFMPPRLVASYTALGLISRPLVQRPLTPQTRAQRQSMRGYFAEREIQPVLFQLEAMRQEVGF